ncbi:MAG: penicillin-binding protein 2 [Oscillospiraceae bacterium]|jgi:cell division protein FtsI/penicillin-binding protein 2|nr:penicillin-binding protein 2 [Oscillospiraceae bacterium]
MFRKRFLAALLAVLFLLGTLEARILYIGMKQPYSKVASQGKARTITVAQSRGSIYDRNGERLVGETEKYFAVLKPNIASVSMLGSVLSEERMAELFSEIGDERPLLVSIPRPLVDTENFKVLKTYERYASPQIAAHLIGYLDSSKSEGVSGIEKSFDELLQGAAGKISASFVVNGFGSVMEGEEINIREENYNSAEGIELTLDKKIQTAVEEALTNSTIEKGAVVVLDVKTSAILAMASRPAFDPNNLAAALDDPNSPFINRALTPYSVGSVYKPIVASAAIAAGIYPDYEYTCTGSIRVNNVVFNCHKHEGHGKINMDEAIALSCNVYFVNLAEQIGKEGIIDLSSKLGLGKSTTLAPNIINEAGILPANAEIKNPGDLANLSFGQGRLMATPLQMAAVYACYANDGVYNEPYLLQKMLDGSGGVTANYVPGEGTRAMSMHITELMKRMMLLTVTDGSGKAAKPTLCTAAGKTATAQSGWYDENGNEVLQTWFAGYFPAEKPQYAVVVMKEDGSTPITDCAPVFKEIADRILADYPL